MTVARRTPGPAGNRGKGYVRRCGVGNYATHKTPKIKAWLTRRPHYHVHFTPTSASWINQVERWFAELTRKQIQRGVRNLSKIEQRRRTGCDRLVAERRGPLPRRVP